MRVVVDTNVLVSAYLNPFGVPGEIARLVSSGRLTLCYDARIMWEYSQVLSRAEFSFDPDHVKDLLNQIKFSGNLITTVPLPIGLPDKSDEPFLEVALAGQVEYLITGNTRHFPKNRCQGMKVGKPADFMEYYRASI